MIDEQLSFSFGRNTTKKERNAAIVRLRKKGHGPTEIAKELNLNINQVIGVCYRAGLCEKKSWL